jgi:4-amino-4-deoxy-L-arabinose transferase-like glycosyltransferase
MKIQAIWLPLVATAIALLYTVCLGRAPIYLSHDEAFFGIQANAIATTARDLNGNFFPLYIHIFDRYGAAGPSSPVYWAQPLHIYSQALFVRIFSLSEAVIRLPTALVGLINIILMYFVGKVLFESKRLGLIASGLLALTPAHFFHSRLAADQLFLLIFVLAWLLCLVSYDRQNRPWQLFLATVFLGVGLYSYIGALFMMPLYFVGTCGLLLSRREPLRRYALAAVGFVFCLMPLVAWLLAHPNAYVDQAHRYRLYDPERLGFLRGLLGLFGYTSLTERASIYWNAFNASMLFFLGDSSLLNATRKAGVFLLPIAVFLPVGINYIVNGQPTRRNLIVLFGLLTAPFGAVVAGELFLPRELVIVPFAILIATVGVGRFLSARRRVWRAAGAILLVLIPVQFAYFAYDYFTAYRIRSSTWFERNLRGALEEVIVREGKAPGRRPYLSEDILWIAAYWQFYLMKHGRTQLLEHTVYFRPASLDIRSVPRGALIVGAFGEPTIETLVQSGELRRLSVVVEPNDTPSFVIFER